MEFSYNNAAGPINLVKRTPSNCSPMNVDDFSRIVIEYNNCERLLLNPLPLDRQMIKNQNSGAPRKISNNYANLLSESG